MRHEHRCTVLLCGASLLISASCTSATEGTVLDASAQPGDTTDSPDLADSETVGADASSTPPLPTVAGDVAMVTVAGRGVSTPWFTPITEQGAGTPIQLGPRRGAGYGQGEGEVSYPDITPDGQHVVVVFYPMATLSSSANKGAWIYALSLTGGDANASPTKVVRADQLHALGRAYRTGWIAYVDGLSLFAARLDGSDLDAPILVDSVSSGMELDAIHWVGETGRLVWTRRHTASSQQNTVWTALLDGTSAGAATQVHVAGGPAKYPAAVLPDGRILVSAADNRLHAVSATGDQPPAVLSPDGPIAGYVGHSADGSRVVLELRNTWEDVRELISVRTDGSESEAPVALTPTPVKTLDSIVSRDGTAAAWVAQNDSGQWAAYSADVTGSSADPRISTWSSQRLYVTDFAPGVLVGGREDGAVLRFGLHGSPSEPTLLDLIQDVVNHSNPRPTINSAATHVGYHANTPTGWHSWVRPLAGGQPQELAQPWYSDLLTERGLLSHEYVHEEAVFLTQLDGTRTALSDWHTSTLEAVRLTASGSHVVYASDSPQPGWYAASTAGQAGTAALVTPSHAASTDWTQWWTSQPLVAGEHLVRRVDGRVESAALDGSDAEAARILGEGTSNPLAVDPALGLALFAVGSDVMAAAVDGSKPPVVLMTASGSVSHISVLPGFALIGVESGSGTILYAAALDGSQSAGATVIANDLPGWFMDLRPSPQGDTVFTVHSIEATAVAHPDALRTAATGLGAPATGLSAPLAPHGYVWWGGGSPFSPDGVHAILTGPEGLYSARSDGTQAEAPVSLASVTSVLGGFSPEGDRIMLMDQNAVAVATIGHADSLRLVTAPSDSSLAAAVWTPDGQRIVLARGESFGTTATGALLIVDASADLATPTPLHSATFTVEALLGVLANPPAALVLSTDGRDHSVYVVPLDDPDADVLPAALTPIDDVGDRWVGLAPVDNSSASN